MPTPNTSKIGNFANITNRQRALLKIVIDCDGNQSETARRMGISQQAVCTRLKKIKGNLTFIEVMDKFGISDEKIMCRINQGLDAERTFLVDTVEDGKILKQLDSVPDHAVRHKYVVTACQLRGRLRTDTPAAPDVNVNVAVGIQNKIDLDERITTLDEEMPEVRVEQNIDTQ